MEKTQFKISFLTYILFIIGILIYIFFSLVVKGELFNLYSENDFPYEDKNNNYKQFWKSMTSVQRLALTETYYQFYFNLTNKLNEINQRNLKNDNRNIEMKINNIISNYTDDTKKFVNVPFIFVSLIPHGLRNTKTKKLLICSHFDGHNLTEGGTAYDNAINVVSMLGTIDALITKNKKLNSIVDFLFDGFEEFGLIGAYQFVDYLKNKSNNNSTNEEYDYLNLEAMGGGPPYAFVIKSNNGNYRIQKALSKTKGSILLASNYIYNTKFTTSNTDHTVFDQEGWKGGVSVFIGKGSAYHTRYDRIDKEEHLKINGNQLLDFVLNYESDGYNGDSIGYGISPICIVLPISFLNISIPIIFIATIIVIIYKEENIKLFFQDLLKEFLCFIIVFVIFLIEGFLVFYFNPNSPASNQVFIILISISGLFLFIIFQNILKIQKWSRFRLVFDSLIMIISLGTDLSITISILTILSLLFYVFENKTLKLIIGILQVFIMSLFFTVLLQVFTQYTTRFNELLGNFVLFALFFIFSYHISVSPLEFTKFIIKKEILNITEENEPLNKEKNSNIKDNKINKEKEILNNYDFPLTFIIYIIFLNIILYLKPYPYSKDYTIRGRFLHVIRDNNDSTMIFHTTNGYNYAKKNLEKSNFSNFKEEDINNYLEIGYSGKAFIFNTNDTKIKSYNKICYDTMPELNFSKIITPYNNSDGTFDFIFKFNLPNTSCIDAIYIYIFCNDCIKKINGKKYINEDNCFYQVLLRNGKEMINDDNLADFKIETNFTLSEYNFKYTVLLNTMKNTETYQEFLNSFGEASVNARKIALVSDTVYKYEGIFPTGYFIYSNYSKSIGLEYFKYLFSTLFLVIFIFYLIFKIFI